MYQETVTQRYDDYFDKKIEEAEEQRDAELAATTDADETKKIERKYKNQISVLKSEKLINHNWNSEWHAADTFNVSIGQGRQNYTPIQLAVYASAVANGGTVYEPYVVEQILNSAGEVVETREPVIRQEADISDATLKKVRNAMCQVTAQGGGAYSSFSDFPASIKVAAKTGTAQPGRAGYREGNKEYYDGLFICFAPADDPQIAFACVMEYGYSGGGSAAKVARAVLREYFGLNQTKIAE